MLNSIGTVEGNMNKVLFGIVKYFGFQNDNIDNGKAS